MLQLSVAKCFRLPYRIIPKVSNVNTRFMADKCKKGGDKDTPKEPEPLKCKAKKEEKKETSASKCADKKKPAPPKCPPKPCQKPPSSDHANMWRRITLMGVFPIVAILTVFVFTSHSEEERPEFKPWPHMYKRSKPYFFGIDGNRTAFHNSHWNPLPPDGYEDEIDTGAGGKPAETDQERDQRLKDFNGVKKEWSKLASQREADAKKAEAAAEKEAKRLQAEAEKEEKRILAEEEKERKRQEAEEKKRMAEEEKERKRVEKVEAKRQKELAKAQKMDFAFPSEPDEPAD